MKTYGTLTWHENTWIIKAEPHVAIRLRRVFPRIAWKDDFIGMADTVEVARELEWFMARYPLKYKSGPQKNAAAIEARLSERARLHRDGESLVDKLLSKVQKPNDFHLAVPARDYQKLFGTLFLATPGILLADDLGTGKTCSAICGLTDGRARPALVCTLTHLPTQWESEIRKFAPRLTTHVLEGTRPYDIARRCGGKFPEVVITSYSKLDGWGQTLAPLVKSVIWDEVQELRNGEKTNKGKAAHLIARKATFRAGLSATPVYNLGGEIHPIMEVIRPGALGTQEEFSKEWCVGDTDKPGKLRIKDPKAMGSYLLDSGLMLRRTRQEIGREIPKLTRVPHMIDCDAYELKKIESKAVELAQIILSKSAQARGQTFQASQELNNLVRQATGIAKARYVAEFVRMLCDSDERVVVYAWHREVYAILLEQLSSEKLGGDLKPAMYTGTESPKQKQQAKERFCGGDARVLLLSLRSGAGLDGLQHHARVGVFAELDWSPGVHEQCLSADTEILTTDGFRGIDDVGVGTTVAAFDVESGTIRWVPSLKKTDRALAAGEQMFSVQTSKIDIRVTGEHRMVVRTKRRVLVGSRRSKWAFELAQDVAETSRRAVPVCGDQAAAGVPLTDCELRFLGWFASDGSFNGKIVTIYQASHQPWNADIVEVLDGCGLNWKLFTRPMPTGGTMNMYCIAKTGRHYRSSKQGARGWQELQSYLDKDVSPLLDEMTAAQLKSFLHGVFMGDGNKSKNRKTTMRITSTNLRFLERLQSLCVRRAMSANISRRKSRTKAGRFAYDIWISELAEATLPSAGKANAFRPTGTTPRERVWCVTNELGTLVTRRNGKVSVVGNCEGRIARDGQSDATIFYYLLSTGGSDPIISDTLGIKRGQIEGIRDPKGAFEHGLDAEGQNVKKLAQQYLLKHGKIRA